MAAEAALPPEPGLEVAQVAPEAVSVEQARRIFGVGRSKLYELMRDGTLPSIKLGKRRLLRPATLREVLAARERRGIGRGA